MTFRPAEIDPCHAIKVMDFVPSPGEFNFFALRIGRDFMPECGFIANDFDVRDWAAPEFLERALTSLD